MNHVYGTGDAPPEKVYKTFKEEVALTPYEYGTKAQKVDVEVHVAYNESDDPVDAHVISVKYKGADVTDLVLYGWDEFEIIDKVMGAGFIEKL